MTNEWAEFKAYTEQPIYTAARKTDTTYLGRFTFDMITDFKIISFTWLSNHITYIHYFFICFI